MQALLGKITHVARKNETSEAISAAAPLEVKFKAACVLPLRTKVPEWLKDQVLTVEREVLDTREVGDPGDNLILTPNESLRWLAPLTVTPGVEYGKLPEKLEICLGWWKEEKLPEFTVKANGRSLTREFTKEGAGGTATVETAPFFPFEPTFPVTFEVTCDKMTAACTVVPVTVPFAQRVTLPEGERYRLENTWYGIDVAARTNAGAIVSLREKGRGIDHFRSPENLIHRDAEFGGHTDRVGVEGWDWSEKMHEAALTCSGIRREGGATRLELEGVVDEGQNLRSAIRYTLYDGLPLLLTERTFHFHKGKGGEKKDEKDEKPKEPIDDMKPARIGFRAAWPAERRGTSGSRMLCMDGDRLVVTRQALVDEFVGHWYWRMTDGWAMAEHPVRGEVTLYLFDRESRPHLATWMGEHTITMEPFWPPRPLRPDEATGFSLALTAGEICGAAPEGAWVAVRIPVPDDGVRCAVVGRLRDPRASVAATISLGGETSHAPLDQLLLPGVGVVHGAAAEFPRGTMDLPFDVAVGGIARRQSP